MTAYDTGDTIDDAGFGITAWTDPTLLNSWINFDAANWSNAQYRRRGDTVELRGTIKSGTIGSPAFTLPVGFRPARSMAFAVNSNGAYGSVTVSPAGNVTPAVGSNTSLHLDGITFSMAAP